MYIHMCVGAVECETCKIPPRVLHFSAIHIYVEFLRNCMYVVCPTCVHNTTITSFLYSPTLISSDYATAEADAVQESGRGREEPILSPPLPGHLNLPVPLLLPLCRRNPHSQPLPGGHHREVFPGGLPPCPTEPPQCGTGDDQSGFLRTDSTFVCLHFCHPHDAGQFFHHKRGLLCPAALRGRRSHQ